MNAEQYILDLKRKVNKQLRVLSRNRYKTLKLLVDNWESGNWVGMTQLSEHLGVATRSARQHIQRLRQKPTLIPIITSESCPKTQLDYDKDRPGDPEVETGYRLPQSKQDYADSVNTERKGTYIEIRNKIAMQIDRTEAGDLPQDLDYNRLGLLFEQMENEFSKPIYDANGLIADSKPWTFVKLSEKAYATAKQLSSELKEPVWKIVERAANLNLEE